MPDDRQMLRIGIYTFFPGGGIGRYTHELLRALGARDDVAAELICSPGFEWKIAPEYQTWDGLYDVWTPRRLQRRWWFLRGQVMNPLRAIGRARTAGHDVLHLANVNHLTFPVWRPAFERSGLRLGVSVHDVKRGQAIMSRSWEDRQLKALYRRADVLFVHSNYQSAELTAFAGVDAKRITVVPHGPYPHGAPSADRRTLRLRFKLPSDRQVALFFGQIRDEKNLDGLLRALASMDDRPHLLIAGKPWAGHHKGSKYYRDLIQHLDLEDCVTFMDEFIPDERVADVFEASDWVVLPYRNSFTSQSGVLNVAAAYLRPVVVSSAPVLSETVARCDVGVACSGDGPADILHGLKAMIKRTRAGHPHEFQRYLDRHSWAENARKTVLAYGSLCGSVERLTQDEAVQSSLGRKTAAR